MTRTIATTLGAIATADAALQVLGALKLSAKAAYHLKKLTQLVAIDGKHYHDTRNGYITELGTLVDGVPTITPDSPNLPTFVAKLTELAAVPVEIPWGPITLDMLGDAQVSAADLAALGPLLADPAPEAVP